MAMNGPPHPGRSIRENCLVPLGLNVTEAAKVLGVAPPYTLARVERPRGGFSGDGHQAGEGRLVQCRVLAAPAGDLRSRPGAQGSGSYRCRALPASADGVMPVLRRWRSARIRSAVSISAARVSTDRSSVRAAFTHSIGARFLPAGVAGGRRSSGARAAACPLEPVCSPFAHSCVEVERWLIDSP